MMYVVVDTQKHARVDNDLVAQLEIMAQPHQSSVELSLTANDGRAKEPFLFDLLVFGWDCHSKMVLFDDKALWGPLYKAATTIAGLFVNP
jgi:hypothetical protein